MAQPGLSAGSASAIGPGTTIAPENIRAEIGQCALKLWRLQGLFRRLARAHGLKFEIDGSWPGLALCAPGPLQSRRLELRLHCGFPSTGREWYEFHYLRVWRIFRVARVCEEFGCGRLYPDELLSETRMQRELEEKLFLLGISGSFRRRLQGAWLRNLRRYPR